MTTLLPQQRPGLLVLLFCVVFFWALSLLWLFPAPLSHVDCSVETSKARFRDAGVQKKPDNPATVVTHDDLPMVLAIYFPQFHPDPLNDRLWGVNFTDWTSLRAAPTHNRNSFPLAHPLPKYGGYYDLRETKVRRLQGELAQKFGIDGFVYHHYWFYDEAHLGPTLQAPLEAMLRDGQPDVPFLFNWCAAPWLSMWTGKAAGGQTAAANTVLQNQYWPTNLTQIRQHYDWLRQFWIHKNYIRVGGHPVLLMYQYFPESFPVLWQFRKWAMADDAVGGLTIWMSRSNTHPDLVDISKLSDQQKRVWKRKSQQIELLAPVESEPVWNTTVAYPYMHEWAVQGLNIPRWCRSGVAVTANTPIWASLEIPGVITAFDNTPRREAEKATIWSPKETPQQVVDQFERSLHAAVYYETCCRRLAVYSPRQKFILVNAWNEWAEGMMLEPSTVYGDGFLQAVRKVKADLLNHGCQW